MPRKNYELYLKTDTNFIGTMTICDDDENHWFVHVIIAITYKCKRFVCVTIKINMGSCYYFYNKM